MVKWLDRWRMEIVCPKGHLYTLEPVIRDPDGGGTYSSDQDFCPICGEGIDHSEQQVEA